MIQLAVAWKRLTFTFPVTGTYLQEENDVPVNGLPLPYPGLSLTVPKGCERGTEGKEQESFILGY